MCLSLFGLYIKHYLSRYLKRQWSWSANRLEALFCWLIYNWNWLRICNSPEVHPQCQVVTVAVFHTPVKVPLGSTVSRRNGTAMGPRWRARRRRRVLPWLSAPEPLAWSASREVAALSEHSAHDAAWAAPRPATIHQPTTLGDRWHVRYAPNASTANHTIALWLPIIKAHPNNELEIE